MIIIISVGGIEERQRREIQISKSGNEEDLKVTQRNVVLVFLGAITPY